MFHIKQLLCLGGASPWRLRFAAPSGAPDRRAAPASVPSEARGGLCLCPWTGLSSWHFFNSLENRKLPSLVISTSLERWLVFCFCFFLTLRQVKTSHLLAHVAWITQTLSVEATGLTQSHRHWGAAIISSILHSFKSTSQTTRCAPSLISSLSR